MNPKSSIIVTDGVVLAIASAKGGVGKTTTSINLGAALQALTGSVVVVEVDLAMANLLDFINIDYHPESDPSLHDVLADRSSVTDAVYEAEGGFDVMPCGPDIEGYASLEPRKLGRTVANLRSMYDVIILDTGAGLSYETLLPLGLADGVILVSTPRLAAVRDTQKTKNLTERVGGTVIGIVFTQSGTGSAPPPDRIADHMGVELFGHVPDDPNIPESQDAGMSVIAYDIATPAAEAYWSMGERVVTAIRTLREGSMQPETTSSGEMDLAGYFS